MNENLFRVYCSHIQINLTTRQLSYYEGERLVSRYPVGVGKVSTPTPTGNYSIFEKVMNPGGALGTRWLGLSIPGGYYGIHGTNNPPSIGGYVSNGCIRMYNQNVEELFPKVDIGTPVIIVSREKQPENAPDPAVKDGTRRHTVQSGENLWQIANQYGVDLNSMIQLNNLANPERIYPGQQIIIPA